MSMSDGTQVSISRVHLPVYSSPSSLPCSSSDVSVSRNHTPCAEYALPDAGPSLIEAGCHLTRTKHVSRRRPCGDRHRSYGLARALNLARQRASESMPLGHRFVFHVSLLPCVNVCPASDQCERLSTQVLVCLYCRLLTGPFSFSSESVAGSSFSAQSSDTDRDNLRTHMRWIRVGDV